jgi:hypothetical protein
MNLKSLKISALGLTILFYINPQAYASESCSVEELYRINFQKLSETERPLIDERFASCLEKETDPVKTQKISNIYNKKSLVADERKKQEEIAELEYYNNLADSDKNCNDDMHATTPKILKVSYIGKTDPRKEAYSPKAEHLNKATGLLVGWSTINGKNIGIRHTSFICEDPQLLCASFHSVCDNENRKPKLNDFLFTTRWSKRNTQRVFIDLSKSWFGKRDHQGDKVYGECPVGVDGKQPVVLRLENPVTDIDSEIRPVELEAFDTSLIKVTRDMSEAKKNEVYEYYKNMNRNSVAVGFHNEEEIDIPEYLKKDRDIKYVQEAGFEYVPRHYDDDKWYNKDFGTKKVDFENSIFTAGYFTPESSGTPSGPCAIINGVSKCKVVAVIGGAVGHCWSYGQNTIEDRKCLNMSYAITPNFKSLVREEKNRIKNGQ